MQNRISETHVKPLCSIEFAEEKARQLKQLLSYDCSETVKKLLESRFAKELKSFKNWYQRIDFPEFGISSTSDHNLAVGTGDRINALGGLLTLEEAAILRPLPKWHYIEPILPDIKGKTVLEVGSNNGFFSFKFAEKGAKIVTGVEVIEKNYNQANWAKERLGIENVVFVNSDIMLDLTIEQHDIVFMTAVHIHFVTFFYGLLRSINLSRELLIIDSGGRFDDTFGLRLHINKNNDGSRISNHAWHISSDLLVDFLYLCGVEPCRITRYIAPWDNHVLYYIDTRGVGEFRNSEGYPIYIKNFHELKFKY